MFWDKGYTPSPNIEFLLEKENLAVEELLDNEDILQECKIQKRNLVQYLTRPDTIKRLIELIITEPPEDVSILQRFKHANMACEILTFGLPFLEEKLVDNGDILQTLYSYLENEPPLNPLLASFFSKTFSMPISKKSEQDWFLYQKMCLQVLEFIKSRGNFLDLIFRHFETPVIMDLLLQIIREIQGGALKKNFYEWLTEQKLVQRLISILGQPEESEKHKNVADFLCDLIRHGRGMRQSDQQENDSYEPTYVGSNPLLQSIENSTALQQLLDAMLSPNASESTIVSGVQIFLTLLDKSIVDEPASDLALQLIIDKEKKNHEIIVATIIEVVEPQLESLHQLLLISPQKNAIITTASTLSPPFGITRLQICRLFTVLLRTGNRSILNAISKTEFLNTLLKLFKEYCWNNFLHNEVEKCLQFIFSYNDNNNDENSDNTSEIINSHQQENNDNENIDGSETNNKLPANSPSALQIYAIVNCRIISKLIDCWMFNKEMQSLEKGRRLGYMGHLIKILSTITTSMTLCEELGALIETDLKSSESDLSNWQLIINPTDGEFTNDLNIQNRLLADCNAYASSESYVKEFNTENLFSQLGGNLPDNLNGSLSTDSALEKLCEYFEGDLKSSIEQQIKDWGNLDNDMDSDMDMFQIPTDTAVHAYNIGVFPWGSDPFGSSGSCDGTGDASVNNLSTEQTIPGGWDNFNSDNFADFDAHFNSFSNDLGTMGATAADDIDVNDSETTPVITDIFVEKSSDADGSTLLPDNNANTEKICNQQNEDEIDYNVDGRKNIMIENIVNSINMKKMQIDDDNELNFDKNKTQENLSNAMNEIVMESKDNENSLSPVKIYNGPLNDRDRATNENIDETEKSDLPSVDAEIRNENHEEKSENVVVTNDVTAVISDDKIDDDSKVMNIVETAVETAPVPPTATIDNTS